MHTTLPAPRRITAGNNRSPLDFAAIFAGLLLVTLLLTVVFWQVWHTNRIYTGVTVAGVPLGGMTRVAAVNELSRRLTTYPLPPVSLQAGDRQWPLTNEQVRVDVDLVGAVNRAYLFGRSGSFSARLGRQLAGALAGYEVRPPLDFDVAQIRYAVSQVAGQVRRPAQPAVHLGTLTVPPQPGLDVDVEATVGGLLQSLETGRPGPVLSVPLVVIEIPPPDVAAASAPVEADASVVAQPLLLTNPRFNLDLAIDPEILDGLLFSTVPLRLDRDALGRFLATWATQLDIPPRDARLRFNPAAGSLSILRTSQVGRKLDVDATIAAVELALTRGDDQAELALVDVPPTVDMNRIDQMGIRELVASGTTYFAGSSAARIRNIEVAAEKLDGVVIPPGVVFSFNRFVEDVSSANGFEDSLIIWGDRTAVGVGGGVCQVSTTVFRAAYAAGLPIVERYNHGYVVDWYGEPGLDATIFTPSVDFRFRNDTGAYLLIEPVVNGPGGTITFNLYGTKPNRQVIIGEPAVSDVREPEAPSYIVDESLTLGEREQVEWPKEGMTVTVERTIVENGAARIDTLTSQYQPWRAVYLVGPGSELPATPAPDAASP